MNGRLSRTGFPFSVACTVALIAACGQVAETTGKAQTAAPSEPSYQDFGGYEVHYNAVRSDILSPDVARAYGIEHSSKRVFVNVSILRKESDGRTVPVDGSVEASAHNLNGQMKNLTIRRITEGPSIYFIGEVGISGAEIIVFDIKASPAGTQATYSVQFKREFFTD